MPASAPAAPPRLTDRAALARQRARATDPWLQRLAADEVQARLAEVNRTFTRAAVVSGWPEVWAEALSGARLVADAETLDLGRHDLIVHAMALHRADDPVGQLVQCARALDPDGLLLAIFPGGETLAELRAALAEAEVAQTGGLSPRVLPMADLAAAAALPGRAGLALPVADRVLHRLSHRDAAHLMADLRAAGEGNAMAARLRRPTRRGVFAQAAATLARRHPDPERPGRLLTTLEMIVLTGWAPAPTQPQPLRPGSARMSLAAALNARTDP